MFVRRACHPRSQTLLLLLLSLVLGSTAVAAAGAVDTGDNFRVSGPMALKNEWDSDIAYNPDTNQFLVVWVDDRAQATRGKDIYARVIGANGVPAGTEFRVNRLSTNVDQVDPAVAYDSVSDQYLVVWRDKRAYSTRYFDIYSRRVSSGGTPLGIDARVASPGGGIKDEWYPDVASNPAGSGWLVVWQDLRKTTWDIYSRRVDSAGAPTGAERLITPPTDHDAWMPALASNPAVSGYLVVWYDYRNMATRKTDIYGRYLDATGAGLGAGFRVSGPGATGYDWEPDVAYEPIAGEYLVVWRDQRNSLRGMDIFGRIVRGSGGMPGGDLRISDLAAVSDEEDTKVAASASGGYLVTWRDGRGSWEIFARRVYGGGPAYGPAFAVTDADSSISSEATPAVSYGGTNGEFVVVWQDNISYWTRGSDIYGQRVAGS